MNKQCYTKFIIIVFITIFKTLLINYISIRIENDLNFITPFTSSLSS